jgi:hypothetical protein
LAARVASKSANQRVVAEQALQGLTQRHDVGWVWEEYAVNVVCNLVLDAAHSTRDDCTSLPHRFGNREPESLFQALLNYHRGVPLDGIHHDGVLLDVVHR